MAPLSLDVPRLPGDAHSLATCQMSAFWPDPFWRLTWSPTQTLPTLIQTAGLRRPSALITSRETYRHQIVRDEETGEVAGYARWLVPLAEDLPEESRIWLQGRVIWPEAQVKEPTEEEREKFKEMEKGTEWNPIFEIDGCGPEPDLNAAMERCMGGSKGFLKLEWLSTHPSYQRQGIATKLLLAGLTVADDLGIPVYILATPRGMSLYKNHGFTQKEALERSYDVKVWEKYPAEVFDSFKKYEFDQDGETNPKYERWFTLVRDARDGGSSHG